MGVCKKALFFYLAGVKYGRIEDVLGYLEEGDDLVLIPEPLNSEDKFAVKVMFHNKKIGYVPKKISKKVSKIISVYNSRINCIVFSLNRKSPPWKICRAMLYFI